MRSLRLGASDAELDDLLYYRQREWRLLGGLSLHGLPCDRDLFEWERDKVLSIDEEFFGRVHSFPDGRARLVDRCRLISHVDDTPVTELIDQLLVPAESVSEVRALVRQDKRWSRLDTRVLISPES